ncbi:unnamed protein product [Gordionus sp. m RMFG-2023]
MIVHTYQPLVYWVQVTLLPVNIYKGFYLVIPEVFNIDPINNPLRWKPTLAYNPFYDNVYLNMFNDNDDRNLNQKHVTINEFSKKLIEVKLQFPSSNLYNLYPNLFQEMEVILWMIRTTDDNDTDNTDIFKQHHINLNDINSGSKLVPNILPISQKRIFRGDNDTLFIELADIFTQTFYDRLNHLDQSLDSHQIQRFFATFFSPPLGSSLEIQGLLESILQPNILFFLTAKPVYNKIKCLTENYTKNGLITSWLHFLQCYSKSNSTAQDFEATMSMGFKATPYFLQFFDKKHSYNINQRIDVALVSKLIYFSSSMKQIQLDIVRIRVIVGFGFLSIILVSLFITFRYIRSRKSLHHKCWGSFSRRYRAPPKENTDKLLDKLSDSPSILMIYSRESGRNHCLAVETLARIIEKLFNCKVILDVWDLERRPQNPLLWLENKMKTSDLIIVIFSDLEQSSRTPFLIEPNHKNKNRKPWPDLLQPCLRILSSELVHSNHIINNYSNSSPIKKYLFLSIDYKSYTKSGTLWRKDIFARFREFLTPIWNSGNSTKNMELSQLHDNLGILRALPPFKPNIIRITKTPTHFNLSKKEFAQKFKINAFPNNIHQICQLLSTVLTPKNFSNDNESENNTDCIENGTTESYNLQSHTSLIQLLAKFEDLLLNIANKDGEYLEENINNSFDLKCYKLTDAINDEIVDGDSVKEIISDLHIKKTVLSYEQENIPSFQTIQGLSNTYNITQQNEPSNFQSPNHLEIDLYNDIPSYQTIKRDVYT